MTWTARVAEPDGTVIATLGDSARISALTLELNGPGGVTISLPTTTIEAEFLIPGREIQILLDDDIVFWGPIVRPRAGLVESTWQCPGLLWYFDHRFMGTADRTNLVTNGDFEDGETGWTFVGGLDHEIDTTPPAGGPGGDALKLTGDTADQDWYATQTYTHIQQFHPDGDLVTLSAFVFVPSAGYVGGALDDFGLVLKHYNVDGEVVDVQIERIDAATLKDTWVQFELRTLLVQQDDTIEVRLYAPHGVAYWDLVTLTLMESLAFDNADVATIIEGIVDYAQNRNADLLHGKSDLNIDVDADPTGVTMTRVYQFADHQNIGEAIEEFVRLGIVDIDFVYTDTTRTLTTYLNPPGKGATFGTDLELDVNLADFTWSWDGERGASSVVMLGPGDGSDRPEGGAVDASFVGGAFTAEIVESAGEEASIGELDQLAAERLKVAVDPQILEVTTMPGAGIIGVLVTGDTVHVVISYGWLNIDADYRVIRIVIDPYTDQATLTLNPIP